jgi:hypothetical protein
MKTRKIVTLTLIAALVLLLAGGVGLVLAQGPPLGASVATAFTYQGQLTDDDDPATGTYDFEFELHDHPTSDSQVGSTVYVDDKEVSDGLFTVLLDFGSGVFTGEARYLEIGVRPGDSSGEYTTLAPRQELTAAPYALHSLSTGSLQGHPVNDTLPTTGQLLQWNGSAWEPTTLSAANRPPVAVLQADPAVLMPDETTTTLSLALSYDPEGGPLTYAFDPTGQTTGAPSSYGSTATEVVPSADFDIAGDYLAAGWVKDGAGAFDVARALVSVYRFCNTIVDSPGWVGEYASLAVVDGRPAIAYFDSINGDLQYVRALDPSGSSWGSPLTLDSGWAVGRYPSLAVVDGRPAIAYFDSTNLIHDLKYVRANDATGSSWPTPLTVDSTGDVGKYASLAVVDGFPAIAYYDDTPNYDLKYVRATNAAGSAWGTPVTVDSDGNVGQYASLAVVDGRPAIAYYDDTNDDLKYVRAWDASGSSWPTPLIVKYPGVVGQYASLAVVDGRPAIAYYDDSPNNDLKYVRAFNASGGSWGPAFTVDSDGLGYASLAVLQGRPAIAYYGGPDSDLKYVRASDAYGSSWGTPVTVDSAGNVGQYASLAVVDGRPAIAYLDNTNMDLRFAIPRQE